ncbi:MAG: SDR family NAD(P)-dependent oxidoreductase [Planctomycetota bacterium]
MIDNAFDLSGRVAFVTGAGQGLGREFARSLAGAGAHVVIAELNPETGSAAAEEIEATGRNARAVTTDVTDYDSVQQAVAQAVDAFGRIDVLVNNAGITIWGEAESAPLDDWRKVVDVNYHGVYHCCRAVGQVMIDGTGGSIINIASMSGVIVNVPQAQASYNSTKAAVIHLTKSLAVEWAPHGVRVNAVSPGFMDTPMARPFFDSPEYGGVWMQRVPMGRPGRPEELAPLVVFLAGDGSSYMTGANVVVDGGYTCE